jgi:hypothetical protein
LWIDAARLEELAHLHDFLLRQRVMGGGEIGGMTVEVHAQLAAMGGRHLRPELAKDALDMLQIDVRADRMGEDGVQDLADRCGS